VFAPNLLRSKVKDEATDAPFATQMLQSMIDDMDRIFDGCKIPKLYNPKASHLFFAFLPKFVMFIFFE
jgi:hypothetical protein